MYECVFQHRPKRPSNGKRRKERPETVARKLKTPSAPDLDRSFHLYFSAFITFSSASRRSSVLFKCCFTAILIRAKIFFFYSFCFVTLALSPSRFLVDRNGEHECEFWIHTMDSEYGNPAGCKRARPMDCESNFRRVTEAAETEAADLTVAILRLSGAQTGPTL